MVARSWLALTCSILFSSWSFAQTSQSVTGVAQNVFENVRPFVYQIKTAVSPDAPKVSYGSSFVVDENGLLVTNYHVISAVVQEAHQEERYQLYLIDHKDDDSTETFRANIVAVDVIHDLALIKVDKKFSGHLSFAEEMPRQGAKIFSIGLPEDLNMSIAEGNYNGIIRYGPYGLIHMATSLNSGMSGGPTVNENGEIVGVNVSVLLSSQDISFSVPLEFAKKLFSNNQKNSAFPKKEQIHQAIETQLIDLQNALFKQNQENRAATPNIPNWAIDPPPVILKCWLNNRDHKKGYYKSVQQFCFLPHATFLSDSVTTGSYKVMIQTFDQKKLNLWQMFRVASVNYNAMEEPESDFIHDPAERDDLLTKHDCKESHIVNKFGVPMLTNFCLRGYRYYKSLYDLSFKLVTLNKTGKILLAHVTLAGFTLENIKKMFQRQIDAIKPSTP